MDQHQLFFAIQAEEENDQEDEILSDVEEEEKQRAKLKKLKIKNLDYQNKPNFIKEYWEGHRLINPHEFFKIPKSYNVSKQVCAKVFNPKDQIVQCFDCRVDETCVICLDCFKNSNHEGHRFFIRKSGFGGCCDCGDPEAWSEKGFCKTHSGQFKDFEIPEKVQDQFNEVFDGLFFLYFYSKLSSKNSRTYVESLLKFLKSLNESDLYYNKLTTKCITRKLPEIYSLHKQLDKRTILQNVLSFHISGKQIDKWFNFMILLFPYYPIKSAIANHYIMNYHLIIDGSAAASNCAISISSQIMTSYKVIEQYSQNNKVGLGAHMKLSVKLSRLQNMLRSIFMDFNFINKLSNKAGLAYWKMHMKNDLNLMFGYYQILKKKINRIIAKEENLSKAYINSKFAKCTQFQYNLVTTIAAITGIVRQDKQTLIQLIKILYSKVANQEINCPLSLYRPYERSLCLALFGYFNLDLNNIHSESINELIEILHVSKQKFNMDCLFIFRRMIKTFLQYSRTLVQPGYQNTLYPYLYFYKIHERILSVSDIMAIKIVILMGEFEPTITIRNIIFEEEELQNIENQFSEEKVKSKQLYLKTVLQQLNLLFISKSSQIYLAHAIDQNCESYNLEIRELIEHILKQNNGVLPYKDFKTYQDHMFHPQSKSQAILRSIAKMVKEKKEFYTNPNQLINIGINLNDFRINVDNKGSFQNPQKTFTFIKQYNIKIFKSFWNQQSIKKLVKVYLQIQEKGGYKFQSSKRPLLSYISTLAFIVDKFELPYSSLLFSEILGKQENRSIIPIQTQKILSLYSQESNVSDMLDGLKLKKTSTKEEKLRRMKEKQQKINQKFNKQDMEQEVVNEEQEQNNICCICKNKQSAQFVCLVNICVKNHEKLLKMGEGVQCISFSTCNHLFDYKCIKKKYSQNKINNSVYCPLCKASANALLPMNQNQELKRQFMERIQHFLSQGFKFKANIFQQIIKSFYHFVLLAIVDIENCFSKRLNLYRIILQILVREIPQKQIDTLYQKFKDKKFSSKLSVKNTKKQNIKELFRTLQFQNNFQQYENQIQQSIIPLFLNRFRGKIQARQNQKEQEEEEELQVQTKEYSSIFFSTTSEIFKLLKKEEDIEYESINPIVLICIKALRHSDYKLDHHFQQPKLQNVLKDLPLRYTPLGSLKKCSACQDFSPDLIMCLLCHWIGCEKCEKGSISNHTNEQHGSSGAVMYLQSGKCGYFVNNHFILINSGNLYADEWGKSFTLQKEWDSYELNIPLVTRIERSLKYDEIIENKRR